MEVLSSRRSLNHLIILTSLRFVAHGHGGSPFAVMFNGADEKHMPEGVHSFQPLPANTIINDAFLSNLLTAARGLGLPVTLIAVSCISSSGVDEEMQTLRQVLSSIVGHECPSGDSVLNCELSPARYTDALVETNGNFLYT
mmetsp:Transcript_25422/g.68826  ORF Transcript_25422/g.68826 Transcript_25422/m.68826 type:complete len:141 (-) Transcript_25422:56-478(-)